MVGFGGPMLFPCLLLGTALAGEPTTVYVVRHAEKVTTTSGDVALTEVGAARAHRLAAMLRDVPLVSVRSTDTRRTRDTGAPTAASHELTVQLYDHEAPGDLVTALKASGGHHLVVGHSNTVPGLVEALGAAPVTPIAETEYDRLYLVVVPDEGAVTPIPLRF